ncbi:MAG: hypothetical protein Q7R76_01995 [Candidatus Woesearchaeota archaeon]|nr:hypothetical protein [Candidatus Woesearchaeota archaeon]
MNRTLLIRCFLWTCVFTLAAWGVLSFGADPDFVFDKFLSAGFFVLLLVFYERFRLNLKIIIPVVFAIALHQAKLYGAVFFGFIQFDMIMHVVGSFAVALVVYQWLIHEERSMQYWKKVAFLTILVAMGIGAVLEIVEYFGYANLPEGGGILHYGEGDEGGWSDTIQDMIFNAFGSLVAVVIMSISVLRHKRTHSIS